MKKSKEKIGALVVTYNRIDELEKNIINIYNQSKKADVVLIVDNFSTDGTEERVKKWVKIHDNLHYINLGENTGGAGGFHYGVNYLLSNGCDYVWMMDDDGRPDSECLEILLSYKNEYDILGPLIYSSSDELHTDLMIDGVKTCDLNVAKEKEVLELVHPFNGTLIPRKVFEKIGNVNKDLFIWGDEQDFRLRWGAAGFTEAAVTSALYYHPKNRLKLRTALGMLKVPEVSRNRKYIFYRNQVYIDLNNRVGFDRVISIARWLASVMFMEKDKIISLRGFVNGLMRDLRAPHIR